MTRCNSTTARKDWQDVPNEYLAEWRKVFFSGRQGLNLSEMCPVCACQTLHKYYRVYRLVSKTIEAEKYIGNGSLWTWCSHCRSYEHYSTLVPEWWHDALPVDDAKLTHQPEALEEALNKNRAK